MACPFFLPAASCTDASLPHPERLPLGDAYAGHCTAANIAAPAEMLHDCNLGYAHCAHLPENRAADAVRFLIRETDALAVAFVLEKDHLPAANGTLVFLRNLQRFETLHPDPRIQRMAECCVQSYLRRRNL